MEYIKAGGIEYECQTVTTGTESITFTMEGQEIASIHTAFKDVTELTVSGEDKTPYGIYSGLTFSSAAVDADDTVSVKMLIRTPTERSLDAIEKTQDEQDALIASILFGEDSAEGEI